MPNMFVRRLLMLSAAVVCCLPFALTGAEPKKENEVVLAGAEQAPKDHVRARVYLPVDKLTAGSSTRFAVVIDVESGWHINANPAGPDFALPTTVAVKAKHGTEAADVSFPKGNELAVDYLDEPLRVYDGRVVLFGTLKVPEKAVRQTEEVTVEVRFQACNDQHCLPPKTAKLTGKIPVAAGGEEVKKINEEIFKADKKDEKKSDGPAA